MAKVDIKSGSTILADGLLQLQDGLAMDGTLRNVADQSNTISPLKLSTSLVSVDSSLGVRTSSPVSNLEIRTSDGLGSVRIYNNDDSSAPFHLQRGNGGGLGFNTFSGGGTIDSPTDRTTLGFLTRFTGQVYVDGSFRPAARIEYYLTSVPSANNLNCAIQFLTANPSNYTMVERAGITSDGNFQIGETIVNNQNSKLFIKGSGSTSATTSLLVQNSSGTELLKVQDDGPVLIPKILSVGYSSSFQRVALNNATSTTFAYIKSPSIGNIVLFNNVENDFDRLQFGGTSASFPSIKKASNNLEIRNADNTFGAGLSVGGSLNASAILQADSTTKGFLPPRMTDAQIRAIASPAEGLVAYNTDISHLCCYQGGAWVKFNHSPM